MDNGGTAIQTHQYKNLGNGVFIYEPICRCYVTEPNTAGTIYCPMHGGMYKRNIIVSRKCDVRRME